MNSDRELPAAETDPDLLERTWADPTGFAGWFSHVDHKSIGRRYLATAFAFFLAGGVLAALMRIQLSQPENAFVSPDLTTRFSPRTGRR